MTNDAKKKLWNAIDLYCTATRATGSGIVEVLGCAIHNVESVVDEIVGASRPNTCATCRHRDVAYRDWHFCYVVDRKVVDSNFCSWWVRDKP